MGQLWEPREPLSRAAAWSSLFSRLAAEEQEWRKRAIPLPEGSFGWLPYPMANFITYLCDAITAAPGDRFLDVGCGPGTKLALARDLFGLDAAGIDISPEYVTAALQRGRKALTADALTWDRYWEADIVYMNRPLADQIRIERHVMEHMAPGAVLILVNGHLLPSELGWELVTLEDGEPVRGVFAKPASKSAQRRLEATHA